MSKLANDYPPEDASDDEIREWLKQPSKNFAKFCGICEAPINIHYWFCKRCAYAAPLIKCPGCASVNIVAEPSGIDCEYCGRSLDRLCNMENGLLGLPYKDWPGAYKKLVSSLRSESYGDQLYDEYTENFVTEDGSETTKVKSQAYRNWATNRCSNELSTEEIAEKYGLTELQITIITSDNMKVLSEATGISHDALRQRKSRLLKQLGEKYISRKQYIDQRISLALDKAEMVEKANKHLRKHSKNTPF